jgi:molybdopterin-containing oxidoreductase family membrane subunit
MIVLNGYLGLNLLIGWVTLGADRRGLPAPSWVKPFIYLSIPWAASIHTVTAFLYAGLPGRGFWLTAVMAPRFLSSAFAAGPALLIILAFVVRKFTRFDPGTKAIQALSKTVTYAIIVNVFLLLCEVFTVFYSGIPDHKAHFEYLFGLGHYSGGIYVPWMWTAVAMSVVAIVMLVQPSVRKNENTLIVACVLVFLSTWIDKGMGMIAGGFSPNPLHEMTDHHTPLLEYAPSAPELMIALGVWAIGALILTALYKVAISVREEELA